RHSERAGADCEERNAGDQSRGAYRIDQHAGRQLAGQGDKPAGGEDETDVDLCPGMRREVDRHKRTETGLNVGEEEAEPVKAAVAAARYRVGGRVARARLRL